MLDIRLIREEPERVRRGVVAKGGPDRVDEVLRLDAQRRRLVSELDGLRGKRNAASQAVARDPAQRELRREELRELSATIKGQEGRLRELEAGLNDALLSLHNLPEDDVPEGPDESGNVVLRTWGEPPPFDFEPLDHLELGEQLDLIDMKRAAKVAGARSWYLKGELVLVQFALIQFTFRLLTERGFRPVLPPVLARSEVFEAMGYLPWMADDMYALERDELVLAATSEQTLGPMHRDEVLDAQELPLRYCGYSSCFRREAGAYGRDTRGILRVHHFDKVEMFSFTQPEGSHDEHEFLRETEETILQALGLPYQLVMACTGELGVPTAKKYDMETWMPGQNRYRETHSTSNCTDFQARRLNIRYRDPKTGRLQFVHTLNGTAIALGRMLIALLENGQRADGSVVLPEPVASICGFDQIGP